MAIQNFDSLSYGQKLVAMASVKYKVAGVMENTLSDIAGFDVHEWLAVELRELSEDEGESTRVLTEEEQKVQDAGYDLWKKIQDDVQAMLDENEALYTMLYKEGCLEEFLKDRHTKAR